MERLRRPWLVASRASHPQKWPSVPRNVADSCELTEIVEPTEQAEVRRSKKKKPTLHLASWLIDDVISQVSNPALFPLFFLSHSVTLHKSVNLFCTLVIVEDKLTDLWGG